MKRKNKCFRCNTLIGNNKWKLCNNCKKFMFKKAKELNTSVEKIHAAFVYGKFPYRKRKTKIEIDPLGDLECH